VVANSRGVLRHGPDPDALSSAARRCNEELIQALGQEAGSSS